VIELFVKTAAIGKSREGIVVGKKEDAPFRLLARTEIPDRDGTMWLSPYIQDALDELDWYFRTASMM
jgi:hypothetical protein